MRSGYKIGLYLIPEHMHSAVIRYMDKGYSGGDFLDAVASGDLFTALMCADETNTEAMRDWVMFFYNYAPSSASGSKERFEDWTKRGGLSYYNNQYLIKEHKNGTR